MFGENLPGIIPTIFWGITTISILVFIHEAGHFLAARALGFKVTEFFIGLPGPSLKFKRGDTTYGVTCIPLGGYVRIPALEGSGPGAELGLMTEEERKEYEKVPAWKRVTVLLAGAFANLLVAVVLLTALFSYAGIPSDRVDPVPDGPAAMAGMPDNVQVVNIDGRRIHNFGQLGTIVERSLPGDTMSVTYVTEAGQRNTIDITLEPRPIPDDLPPEIDPADLPPAHMGVLRTQVVFEQVSVFRAFSYSFTYIAFTAEAIGRLLSPQTFPEAIGDASSVIGISVISAHTAAAGFLPFVSLIALISISLGLMNLLPVPPLDGGKILFEIIQKITGKPVSQNLQVGISFAGFAILIVLMIYLMGQDLFRIFG